MKSLLIFYLEPRNIQNEIIFTGNTDAKIPFENILEKAGEELREKFYADPGFNNVNLLNNILERVDKELAEAFLNENPFIRKLLIKVNYSWAKEDNTPWFLNNLGAN